jgi:hypothetical protein
MVRVLVKLKGFSLFPKLIRTLVRKFRRAHLSYTHEKEIQQRVARSLILQINCVVKLTQQMRTEDPRYLELLERLRHGKCNYADYELLLTRVVGQPSVNSLNDSPWNKVSFTFRF